MHRTRKTTSETTAAAVKTAPAKTTKARVARRAAKPAGGSIFDPSEHQQEIAQEAYYAWLERGAGHGSAAEDWARAESLVGLRYRAD